MRDSPGLGSQDRDSLGLANNVMQKDRRNRCKLPIRDHYKIRRQRCTELREAYEKEMVLYMKRVCRRK